MKISDILTLDRIKIGLESTTKQEVIEELISLLPVTRQDEGVKTDIVEAILARETICSTGIGEGVALPHAKLVLPRDIDLVFGLSHEGIDFTAMDGKPVFIFFLLISNTDSANLHLKMLGHISRMMHEEEHRRMLRQCTSRVEALEFFGKIESGENF